MNVTQAITITQKKTHLLKLDTTFLRYEGKIVTCLGPSFLDDINDERHMFTFELGHKFWWTKIYSHNGPKHVPMFWNIRKRVEIFPAYWLTSVQPDHTKILTCFEKKKEGKPEDLHIVQFIMLKLQTKCHVNISQVLSDWYKDSRS